MKLLNLLLCLLMFLSIESNAQTPKDSLYVFVGKKISVDSVPTPNEIDSTSTPGIVKHRTYTDYFFKATYLIVSQVYNHYKADTITFTATDHYGIPAFSKYDYVLLFVSNVNGQLYHQKYLYYNVYPTKSGCWAGIGNPFWREADEDDEVVPKFKKLKKPVVIDIGALGKNINKRYFKEPYFNIKGNTAIATKGVCVDQLFEIMKEGIISSWHILKYSIKQLI